MNKPMKRAAKKLRPSLKRRLMFAMAIAAVSAGARYLTSRAKKRVT